MENLALEISKMLNVSIEKAIELLPLIRDEFIYYSILSKISLVPTLIMGLLIFGCVALFIFHIFDIFFELDFHLDGMLKLLLKILAVFVIIVIILNVLMYMLAPNFIFIKEMIF